MKNQGFTPIRSGFTLVELIVAISVTVILGLILTSTLTQTLQGETKAKLIGQVKQSGQVTLDRLSDDIRQSEVVCPEPLPVVTPTPMPTPGIGEVSQDTYTLLDALILSKDGTYTRYGYYSPTAINEKGNGFLAADVIDWVPGASCELNKISPNFNSLEYLTNLDSNSGFDIERDGQTPVFTVSGKPGYPDTVTIRFVAKGSRSSSMSESSTSQSGVILTTSVSTRQNN